MDKNELKAKIVYALVNLVPVTDIIDLVNNWAVYDYQTIYDMDSIEAVAKSKNMTAVDLLTAAYDGDFSPYDDWFRIEDGKLFSLSYWYGDRSWRKYISVESIADTIMEEMNAFGLSEIESILNKEAG